MEIGAYMATQALGIDNEGKNEQPRVSNLSSQFSVQMASTSRREADRLVCR